MVTRESTWRLINLVLHLFLIPNLEIHYKQILERPPKVLNIFSKISSSPVTLKPIKPQS